MTKTFIHRNMILVALTMIAGLGLALAMPWLAKAQDGTPELPTRYYVSKSGNGSTGREC
jgi:hypothetical protein